MRLALLLALLPVSAFAQAAPSEGSPIASLLPLLLIFCVFYLFLIRPQQKRFKEHQAMINGIKKGDDVVTAGGVVGKVTKLEGDAHVMVQIAQGVEVKVLKSTISSANVKPDTTKPASASKEKAERNDNAAPSKDSIANDN
jgi:preprotein translocase subunit YajC